MKKIYQQKIFWVVLVLLGMAGAFWWNSQSTRSSRHLRTAGKLHIVTTGYVPYTLTREIGGEEVALEMLVPPGTEPHSFEPTPGSIIAVDKSDLFLYVSDRLEPWVKDILKGLPGVTAVPIGQALPDEDPHIWLTPLGALSMARQIEAALSKADPAHKEVYKQNFKRFEQEMRQLHQAFEKGLQHCKYRDLIHIGHLAFGGLADMYHLNLQALSNTSHQGEHSVYKLTGMVRFVRGRKIPAVFTEEMVSPDLANTVAQETGVKILPLYTIEEVSKQDFEKGVRYSEYMQRNLHHLQEGLRCPVL